MSKNMTECARSAVMLTGKYPNAVLVDILPRVAQGCTLSPNILRQI